MLHSQLENERAILQKMLRENRRDIVAQVVLRRIAKEIQSLQGRIDEKKDRKETSLHARACGFIYHVFQVVFRLRNYKDRWFRTIFNVYPQAILQTEAVIR